MEQFCRKWPCEYPVAKSAVVYENLNSVIRHYCYKVLTVSGLPTQLKYQKDYCKHLIDYFFANRHKELAMQTLETLTIDDMARIFRLSRVSIYRRLHEARAGRGGLPLPIPSGPRQRIRWNAEDVRRFLQNANEPQVTPTQKFESAKSRQKRHAEAMKKLESFGIKAVLK